MRAVAGRGSPRPVLRRDDGERMPLAFASMAALASRASMNRRAGRASRAVLAEPLPPARGDARYEEAALLCERKIDGEYAALARQITDTDRPARLLHRPATDREPEPKPRAVGGALGERLKKLIRLASGEPTTLVFDLDQYAVSVGERSQRHTAVTVRELECVLQDVRNCRGEEVPVGLDLQRALGRHDHEFH